MVANGAAFQQGLNDAARTIRVICTSFFFFFCTKFATFQLMLRCSAPPLIHRRKFTTNSKLMQVKICFAFAVNAASELTKLLQRHIRYYKTTKLELVETLLKSVNLYIFSLFFFHVRSFVKHFVSLFCDVMYSL